MKHYFCVIFWECIEEKFFDKDGNVFTDPRDPSVPKFKSKSDAQKWYEDNKATIGKPITDRTVQLVELTVPDELPNVGETFKFGKCEYIAVSKFTDNGEDFIVAKKQRTDGLWEYSHIFYIDKVLYELKKRN